MSSKANAKQFKQKRRAKLKEAAKIPGSTTGLIQEANGPFQGQEMTAEQPPDKPKSVKTASEANSSSSSSDDSESDQVDVTSDAEYDEVPPRNAVQTAVDEITKEFHVVLNSDQMKRKKQLDEADRRAKEAEKQAVETVENSEVSQNKPDEIETAEKVVEVHQNKPEVAEKETVKKPKFEVVIVGTLKDMPTDEIAQNAEAIAARRIFKRIDGQRQPTTAVVLTYNEQPPEVVFVYEERFRTRDYIRPTLRCYNCQGWNHRQQGCRKPARCARCGESHKTKECKMEDETKAKCANCSGNHSAASPSCSKFQQVKQAWKTVAEEKLSYAEAIRKAIGANSVKSGSAESRSRQRDADRQTVDARTRGPH